MTPSEIDAEKRRARELAQLIGGSLAVLLGLRTAEKPVVWDPATARFIVDGRFVSMDTVRAALRTLEVRTGVKMSQLAEQLTAGLITLDQWQSSFRELVGSSHILAAALAVGSIAAAAESATVQENIERERKFADGFARDIPRKQLSKPTIKARAKSYLLAAAITFGVVQQAVKAASGYNEAMRTRTAEESCGDCIEVADTWMPIEDMPPLGSLKCGWRCRCYLEYR